MQVRKWTKWITLCQVKQARKSIKTNTTPSHSNVQPRKVDLIEVESNPQGLELLVAGMVPREVLVKRYKKKV
jgi:hypothetical protein